MPTGPITTISDIVEPSVFTAYTQTLTEEKSAIVASGAMVVNDALSQLLGGGGSTFHVPSFDDVDNDDARISTETPHAEFTGGVAEPDPAKITGKNEIAVRVNRNQSWSSADLTAALAGADPMAAIGARVGAYWQRQLQRMFIATMAGVFADNAAAPAGTEHVANDLTFDAVGGVTTASAATRVGAENVIDAALTMGDSIESLTMMLVHSVTYGRLQKQNLIDFIPDSEGRVRIPTYLGRRLIIDDAMPTSDGVYETWLFGPGALQWGIGSPKVPTEIERKPGAGNGGGQEVLYNRVEWCIHPVGHQFSATSNAGGPSNAATTGNLAAATSWQRCYPERKQIKIARLLTRETDAA